MKKGIVETNFEHLDQLVEMIATEQEVDYMEALQVGLEIAFTKELTGQSQKIQNAVDKIKFDTLEKEEVRKILQLVILKSMKGATQTQHLLTPDTVALYMSYIANKLMSDKEQAVIFDPACGTANLLTAVINQLTVPVQALGSEVDPTLINLAVLSANLQKNEVEFFHQDSLQPLLVDPVDLIVCDLPVGYYPDDFHARTFKVHVQDDHTYAHHLLIEQSVKYVKDGGYLLFVIPNGLFDSEQANKLHEFIQEHVHIIGLLQLPNTIFRSEQNAKSILILQKKGEKTAAPKEALMAQLPSFKNSQATTNIVNKINQWFIKEGY